MRLVWAIGAIVVIAVIAAPLPAAADDERDFFDGIEARNVGPFRGGRAMVAVGVPQNPHTYYMGATGGVWKTTNAGARASWSSTTQRSTNAPAWSSR